MFDIILAAVVLVLTIPYVIFDLMAPKSYQQFHKEFFQGLVSSKLLIITQVMGYSLNIAIIYALFHYEWEYSAWAMVISTVVFVPLSVKYYRWVANA